MLDKNCGLYVLGETAMTAIHYTDSCSVVSSVQESANNFNLNSINAYPNPFSNSTAIEFYLSESKNVSISILDVMERIEKTISTKNLQQGKNKITIDLSELNNGIYFCKLNSKENSQTIKLIKN